MFGFSQFFASDAGAVFGAALAQNKTNFDLFTVGQNVVNGLRFGSIYALVAMGIVLIYKSSDVVNFGHGEMGMFCTFICFAVLGALLPARLSPSDPLPTQVELGSYLLALLVTLAFAALLGFVFERFLLRPLSKAPILSQVMVTIGAGILLYGFASLIWKSDQKVFPNPEIVDGPPILMIGSGIQVIPISREVVMALVIGGIASLVLFLFFKYTMVGTAIRAMALNPNAAKLMGVNVGFLTGLTWMIALGLAAIAGMLIAPKVSLSPTMMAGVAANAFAAAVLGGMNSLPGAIVGGLLIGIIDNLVGYYFLDAGLRGLSAFIIIVVVLTVRPNGLLGKTVRKKV